MAFTVFAMSTGVIYDGNGTTPVPLPGPAGLMGGALALMGVVMRRRRLQTL
jgi:uncharacterized protein (TIGR03382 family)